MNDRCIWWLQTGEQDSKHDDLERIDHSPEVLEGRSEEQTDDEVTSHDRLDRGCKGVLKDPDDFDIDVVRGDESWHLKLPYFLFCLLCLCRFTIDVDEDFRLDNFHR